MRERERERERVRVSERVSKCVCGCAKRVKKVRQHQRHVQPESTTLTGAFLADEQRPIWVQRVSGFSPLRGRQTKVGTGAVRPTVVEVRLPAVHLAHQLRILDEVLDELRAVGGDDGVALGGNILRENVADLNSNAEERWEK